jgi:cyanophycinase
MDARVLALQTPSFLSAILGGRPLFLFRGWCCALLALVSLMTTAARAEEPKPAAAGTPTGILFIAGGGRLPEMVRRHFVDLAGGKSAHLVVIPTATIRADQPMPLDSYLFFKSLGVKSVEVLHTRDRKKADDAEFVKPLTEATGVWLTGGDQSRLSAAYHGTATERELRKLLVRGGVIGGTSAGAAVMSSLMITGGTVDAEVGTGFGLLAGVVIDMHFQNRNRLHRLLGVLAKHPECTGVGIDEETALIVQGATATVEGNGNVRACFCPHGALSEANVQVLKNGEKLDLAALLKKATASLQPAPAATGKTTADMKPMESKPASTERSSTSMKP